MDYHQQSQLPVKGKQEKSGGLAYKTLCNTVIFLQFPVLTPCGN